MEIIAKIISFANEKGREQMGHKKENEGRIRSEHQEEKEKRESKIFL